MSNENDRDQGLVQLDLEKQRQPPLRMTSDATECARIILRLQHRYIPLVWRKRIKNAPDNADFVVS
jgi:hypothetical protein